MSTHEAPRLLVIGIDSGDPALMLRLADEGQLPALARLRERGVWARIDGPSTLGSHATWPTVVSGISAFEHGCALRWGMLAPGRYGLGPAASPPPFWLGTPEPAGPVAVIDVPDMDPLPMDPLSRRDDAQLFDWCAHPFRRPPRSEPPELAEEVVRRFGAPIRSDERRHRRFGDRRVARQLLERVSRKGALCHHLLDQRRFETLFVVFGDAHAAGHRFWRHAGQGGARPSRDPRLRGALARVHEAIDAEIAGLMRRAPEADVFLVSNQGIDEGTPDVGLTRLFCSRLGYLHHEPGFAAGGLLERLRRRLGRWGLSGAADPYAGVDWKRTRAYPVPSTYTGAIRINLRGREPEGCVAPEDYAAELDRIERDLHALVDARSGAAAASRVVRTADAFGSAEPPRGLPDLFVTWAERRVGPSEVTHPKATLRTRISRHARTNQHRREGLVVAAGPSIRAKGDLGRVEPEALAPAFRRALGRDAPGDAGSAFCVRAMAEDRPSVRASAAHEERR